MTESARPTLYRRLRSLLHPLRVLSVDFATWSRRRAARWRMGYRLGLTQSVRVRTAAFALLRDGSIPERLRSEGAYEPVETEFLAGLLRDKAIFVDIGANVGYFSLLAAKTQPTATILAFEPCSHTFDLLQANIRLNNASNIQAHRLAVSNAAGTVAMQVNADGLEGLNTLGKPVHFLSQVVGQEAVSCVRLDDFLRDHGIGHVDVIKIDVEGAELLAFMGATELLSQPRAPLILFELSRLCEDGFGHPATDVLDFLRSRDYRLFYLLNEGLQPLVSWGGHECTAVAAKEWHLETLLGPSRAGQKQAA